MRCTRRSVIAGTLALGAGCLSSGRSTAPDIPNSWPQVCHDASGHRAVEGRLGTPDREWAFEPSQWIVGPPVVDDRGAIVSTTLGTTALDFSSERAWHQRFDRTPSGLALEGDRVVWTGDSFGTPDSHPAAVRWLDRAARAVRWSRETSDSHSGPVTVGDRVLPGNPSGRLGG